MGDNRLSLALKHLALAQELLSAEQQTELGRLSAKESRDKLEEWWGEFIASPVKNAIALIAEHNYWEAFREMAIPSSKDLPRAVVITARPLSSADETAFRQKIEQVAPVGNVQFLTDPELIGGVKVRIGDEEIDASLRGKLAQLL